MARALEGIRVIDLTHVLAGATATMMLADLGAEVIHIEPPQGDDAREFGPFAGGPEYPEAYSFGLEALDRPA